MRPRLNLWLKKRGSRRTGSPRWAASGEVLYNGVLIVVGLVAAWLHITSVLAPEWRRRDRLTSFEQARCVIVETKLDTRQGVGHGVEYLPKCLVQIERGGEPSAAVLAEAGDPTTSRRRAARQLARWTAGDSVDCWFDPAAPSDVVLSRAGHGWPLIVLAIPLSLVILGVVGGVRAVLRGGASDEFRRLVAQAALEPGESTRAGSPPAASGLPPADAIGDSPGVRLRYRLPLNNQDNWRLAAMLFICVAWNALVGFFLYGVIHAHVTGAPDWAVTLVIAPLAIAGGWLAYQMLRDARGVSGVGATRVELSDHPLRPGGIYRGVVVQPGQFVARTLTVVLTCQEIATYREGTDTRRSIEEVRRDVLLREVSIKIEPDKPFEAEFDLAIPAGAMHSLQSPHNEVRWSIEVAGVPARWPKFRRRFWLCVYPVGWPDPNAIAHNTTMPAEIVA